jgi:predicted nucleic acid-binding protein
MLCSSEPAIKDITINLRASYKIKLPDAVIAATAIYFDLPLFTMDKGFEKITDLQSVILSL